MGGRNPARSRQSGWCTPLHRNCGAHRIQRAAHVCRGHPGPNRCEFYLSYSLREKSSPYLRVGRGEYTLKTIAEKGVQDQLDTGKSVDQVAETGALRAFGMFWQRDFVWWSGTRLLGRQGAGATEVNFAGQVGVYLLHDRERVIYVGRATDSPLRTIENTYRRSPRAGCFWLELRLGFPNQLRSDLTCWLGGGQQGCRSLIRKTCVIA